MKPGGDAGLLASARAVLKKAMRSALIGFSIGGLAALLCGQVAAAATPETPGFTALNAMLPGRPGNKACYVRSYDTAHLRAHPRQRVTAMRFLLAVETYDPKPAKAERPQDLFYYTFSMSVSRRGDKRLLRTSGDCMGSDGIFCVVDCDGGSMALENLPPPGSLIVRLSDDGIRIFHDCDDEQGVLVKAGADDKVFSLDKTAGSVSETLPDRE
jgi:hypothetical protein